MGEVTRRVENQVVYRSAGQDLVPVGQGVTFYTFAWRDHIVGEGLRHELITAGLPPTIHVTARQIDDKLEVTVSMPENDSGHYSDLIERFLDAHEGTEAADHRALVEFTGSVREAAKRMAEGEHVSPAERDIVVGVLVGRIT